MKEAKVLFRKYLAPFCALLILSVFLFLLYPDVLFGLLSAVLSLSLGLLFFCQGFREKEKREKEISSLSFFSSFLSGLSKNRGSKTAYENASRYLVGYEEVIPFEEAMALSAAPYSLGDFGEFFLYAARMEAKNQIHLPNYSYLIQQSEKAIQSEKKQVEEGMRRLIASLLILLFAFFALLVLLAFFPKVKASLSNWTYGILSLCSLSFLVPLSFFLFRLDMKGAQDVR
jgi:hypothetical protein